MGLKKLRNELLRVRSQRKDCFSKRSKGVLKKLYELAYITGCGVHVVIEAEDGNVYEFHRKMDPDIDTFNTSPPTTHCNNSINFNHCNTRNTHQCNSSSIHYNRPASINRCNSTSNNHNTNIAPAGGGFIRPPLSSPSTNHCLQQQHQHQHQHPRPSSNASQYHPPRPRPPLSNDHASEDNNLPRLESGPANTGLESGPANTGGNINIDAIAATPDHHSNSMDNEAQKNTTSSSTSCAIVSSISSTNTTSPRTCSHHHCLHNNSNVVVSHHHSLHNNSNIVHCCSHHHHHQHELQQQQNHYHQTNTYQNQYQIGAAASYKTRGDSSSRPTSSAAGGGGSCHKRLFFNGQKLLDTGVPFTQEERQLLRAPCPCFDCQAGLSDRLYDAVWEEPPAPAANLFKHLHRHQFLQQKQLHLEPIPLGVKPLVSQTHEGTTSKDKKFVAQSNTIYDMCGDEDSQHEFKPPLQRGTRPLPSILAQKGHGEVGPLLQTEVSLPNCEAHASLNLPNEELSSVGESLEEETNSHQFRAHTTLPCEFDLYEYDYSHNLKLASSGSPNHQISVAEDVDWDFDQLFNSHGSTIWQN